MIDIVIEQRRRDLGGFEVGRVLPHATRRMVGPFVFFDHMGPVDFAPGIPRSVDVRPHPHIGLSTLTYLFVCPQYSLPFPPLTKGDRGGFAPFPARFMRTGGRQARLPLVPLDNRHTVGRCHVVRE